MSDSSHVYIPKTEYVELQDENARLTRELAGESVTTELGALRATVAEDQEVIESYKQRAEQAEALLRELVEGIDEYWAENDGADVVKRAREFSRL